MPPLISEEIEAGGSHEAKQDRAIAHGGRRDVHRTVVRRRRERVERGAHVERGAAGVDQRQVHRRAHGVR